MFNQAFESPRFRPAVNIGCGMDIPSGHYELGKHDESLMNGGVSSLTGITARPNNFKTAVAIYILLQIRRCFNAAHTIAHDTEGTLPISRFANACSHDPYLSAIDYDEDEQFMLTDLSKYSGDEWFKLFCDVVSQKQKAEKKYAYTTPFVNKENEFKKALYPTAALIDSFSKLSITSVDEMYKKNNVGSSGNNTDAMSAGKAKNQLLNQIPQLCAKNGIYLVATAHTGDVIQMEAYPTDKRNLSHMKKDTALKGVSSNFYTLPNNLWDIRSNKLLQTKDKTPEYPWDNKATFEGDTDLVVLTMINLRGKDGLSGVPITVVVSQSEGVLPSLSDFHRCKTTDRFGMGGNVQNYYLELAPDITLSRTKVRKKLAESYPLQRAAQFTSEILQLYQYKYREYEHLLMEPVALYTQMKKLGYDWDVLLDTRGYWIANEDVKDHPKPYLSTMCLLRAAAGQYIPYWMDKETKKTIQANIAKQAQDALKQG